MQVISFAIVDNPRFAQTFIDYMLSLQVTVKMQQGDDGIELLCLEQQLAVVQQQWQQFINNPNDDKYLQASWDVGTTSPNFKYVKTSSYWLKIKRGAGPLTLMVMLLCTVIFASIFVGLGNQVYDSLFFFNDLSKADFSQFWRFFTPSLLHFSLLHLLMNLLWWWLLGGLVERKLGTKELGLLLLAAGIVPSLLQYYLVGPNFGGLSGVVFGLFGYVWMIGTKAPKLGVAIPNSYLLFVIGWMVLGFMEVLDLNMANYAHLGGLIVGLLQGWLKVSRQKSQ
ncbi:rhomboid family intramembrane serine protease GlpG [Paraferrimonas sp. SM1919]|uniref:rhomboid family intramembrane serine protease GlpG n=1 Tax=Paraferrimonas sp. SM1919 TaxID=2662263 RepID=UPI0013D3BB6E|nr:rhomboid family intramembrane serine protease GlpG [Paraferrimonas sp. SM1919]